MVVIHFDGGQELKVPSKFSHFDFVKAVILVDGGKEQLPNGTNLCQNVGTAQVANLNFANVAIHVDGGKEELTNGNRPSCRAWTSSTQSAC